MGITRRTWAGAAALLMIGLAPAPGNAVEIRVMSSAGFKAAYLELAAAFSRDTGHTIVNAWGPSMGDTPQAVPNRIARGEPVDVVIGVREALVGLGQGGKLVAASRVDLARSLVAMAVKAGAPKPDIATLDGFKRALLAARSIAYSDSASGVYLERQLFPRLGVWEAIRGRSRMIPADPVGEIVARGEAELGFQQMSELKPVAGIDIVGPIPADAQAVTTFSAALSPTARQPDAARALIAYLASPGAAETIRCSGMEPGAGE